MARWVSAEGELTLPPLYLAHWTLPKTVPAHASGRWATNGRAFLLIEAMNRMCNQGGATHEAAAAHQKGSRHEPQSTPSRNRSAAEGSSTDARARVGGQPRGAAVNFPIPSIKGPLIKPPSWGELLDAKLPGRRRCVEGGGIEEASIGGGLQVPSMRGRSIEESSVGEGSIESGWMHPIPTASAPMDRFTRVEASMDILPADERPVGCGLAYWEPSLPPEEAPPLQPMQQPPAQQPSPQLPSPSSPPRHLNPLFASSSRRPRLERPSEGGAVHDPLRRRLRLKGNTPPRAPPPFFEPNRKMKPLSSRAASPVAHPVPPLPRWPKLLRFPPSPAAHTVPPPPTRWPTPLRSRIPADLPQASPQQRPPPATALEHNAGRLGEPRRGLINREASHRVGSDSVQSSHDMLFSAPPAPAAALQRLRKFGDGRQACLPPAGTSEDFSATCHVGGLSASVGRLSANAAGVRACSRCTLTCTDARRTHCEVCEAPLSPPPCVERQRAADRICGRWHDAVGRLATASLFDKVADDGEEGEGGESAAVCPLERQELRDCGGFIASQVEASQRDAQCRSHWESLG